MQINWETTSLTIAELKQYDANPRQINKKAFNTLVRSIKEDGYHQRIIVDADNRIIGGHSRRNALLKAGYQSNDRIEVLKADRTLSDDEFRRINIRDNLGYGEFDFEILANEFDIEKLVDWGMDESMFPNIEVIDEITEADDQVDTDVDTRCKLGDVWVLGNHRLMCGDSTNADSVQRLMADNKPIIMVTDPPYGVNYDASWREKKIDRRKGRALGKVENDHRADWQEAYSLFSGDIAYIWHSSSFTHVIAKNLEDLNYKLISLIIWNKQHFAISRGDYHDKHEPCWYAVKNGKTHNWQGSRKESTIWDIQGRHATGDTSNMEESTGHSTQKPIECMLKPIVNNTKAGEYVYDPFGGSGTTLIACEKSNRNCLMMELSPTYCDIIINRWEKHTGQMAELERVKD